MDIDTKTLDKLVADCIPASPQKPRTLAEIADELSVSQDRVKASIARIKDLHPDLPLTSSGYGYRWSLDKDDVQRHATKEIKYVSTRTRRSLLDGLLAPYQSAEGSEHIERARQRIEFILDDLSRIVA